LLLATFIPVLASAAQLTERSIALSSSSKDADNVSYEVKFTTSAVAGAFVMEFCSNTPLLGEACTAPTGFDVSAATVAGFTHDTTGDNTAANRYTATGTISSGANTITFVGVDNPTDAGALYARIVTYTDGTDAAGYTTANPDVVDTHIDDGGVAMYITDSASVSAAVLESMIFCVAKVAPTADCANAAANPPVLELGEDVGGGVIALTPTVLSTGSLFTQISTNAATGAIVNLKSSATDCGGLLRAGAPTECDIAPAGTTGTFAAGAAKFGVKAAAVADPVGATSPSGTFQVKSGGTYNGTDYRINGVADNSAGVTSTYGDQFLDTAGAPVNNRNMELTFAASIANNTPAGRYSADLSLIATGKF